MEKTRLLKPTPHRNPAVAGADAARYPASNVAATLDVFSFKGNNPDEPAGIEPLQRRGRTGLSCPPVTHLGTIVTIMDTTRETGNVLFGATRRAILALTFLRPDESFYLREIVRRTGCGVGAVQRELKLLTECGILRRDRHRFYSANPQSAIFEPLKQIVIQTIGLGDRLRTLLSSVGSQIAIAFMFGSLARGDHHQASDVDVLIITNDDELQPESLHELLAPEQSRVGREINAFVLSADEWRLKLSSGNPFIRRMSESEKIFLIGGDNELAELGEKRLAPATQTNARRNHRPAGARGARSQKRAG